MPPPIDLSLCMMVKNEAHHLPQCLDSVRELAREIVLVDTGSTDDTAEVATSYGAKVFRFDFTNVDFAAARNHALAQATGRWILILDADEFIPPQSLPRIPSILASNPNSGYYLERHNHLNGSPTFITDYVVRLIPNRPCYRYRGRVHETIDASILSAGHRLVKSEILIHHDFVSDPARRRAKNLWYIQILKEEIAADPADTSRLDFLAAEYHQLEMYAEATAVAERIVQLRPSDARAHLFAGTYNLLYQPDFVQARNYFNHALRLQPHYPEVQSFLRLLNEKESHGCVDSQQA